MENIKNIHRLEARLASFIKNAGSQELQVGFINGAKYPDGEQVATVAFNNEYGTKNIPSRPFFRTMISKESPTWSGKLTKAVHFTHYDFQKSLELLGIDVEGALRESIRDWKEPPNSPETIAKKGFNKPLIDTSLMIKSITSEVKSV